MLIVEDIIHLSSPLIYIFFVHCIQFLPSIQNNQIMIFFRWLHNINLSIVSLFMFIGITIGQFQTGKFDSLDALLCQPYGDNLFVYYSVKAFLWSKYLEWGDTLFLQLSGKPISMLQYTHHMSTAILVYSHIKNDFISPFMYVFQSLNCVIHVFMYWYFAYPHGLLHRYRKLITSSQIVQHIICLTTIVYTMSIDNCKQNRWGNELGLALYSMYLFYFVAFYL